MVLGGADEENSSEIAYMIRSDEWEKKYGYEAVGALVLFYAPALKSQDDCQLPNGEPFERIIATSRQDNVRSQGILKKLGFKIYGQSEKFRAVRDLYELRV